MANRIRVYTWLKISIDAIADIWMIDYVREVTHRKLLQGCMTQFPAAFCRNFSFISAFLFPNNFIASLLSDGWKNEMIWSLRKLLGDRRDASVSRKGDSSSFGVPYRLISSPRLAKIESLCLAYGVGVM